MDVSGMGELVPIGGGDPIPLVRSPMVMGRRESCDIYLPFPNISGRHCELHFKNGFWLVRDLNSTNGMKVNGEKVQPGGKIERNLEPYRKGLEITIVDSDGVAIEVQNSIQLF